MKQKISLAIDKQRSKTVARKTVYQQAKAKALAQLSSPFRLGGGKMPSREALHDRQDLR